MSQQNFVNRVEEIDIFEHSKIRGELLFAECK